MATYTLAPVPGQVFLDDDGQIIPGGLIWTYDAGTMDLAATYTTPDGIAHTNPIQLDGFGRVPSEIYLPPGTTQKWILETAATPPAHGVTLRTYPTVAAVPISASNQDVVGTAGETLMAGQVAYISDGSGSLNAGQWYRADADFIYAAVTPEVGFVVDAIASGDVGTFRKGGSIEVSGPLTPGASYFVSATAGAITASAPTNARYVGQAASATTLNISANPSFASVLTAKLRINAGTPYPLTWPAADASGFLKSDGAGTLTFAGLPAGSIRQVVSASYSTQTTSSSSTYADTGLTATITPASATNKILVLLVQNGCGKGTGNTKLGLQLNRAGSDILSIGGQAGTTGTTATNLIGAVALSYLDSPASASAVIYKTRFRSEDNIATAYVQNDSAVSTLTLLEVVV